MAVADTLLALRDALEGVQQAWADDLTAHIATLESAGTATTEQQTEMGSKYREVIAQALAGAEDLVGTLGVSGFRGDDEE